MNKNIGIIAVITVLILAGSVAAITYVTKERGVEETPLPIINDKVLEGGIQATSSASIDQLSMATTSAGTAYTVKTDTSVINWEGKKKVGGAQKGTLALASGKANVVMNDNAISGVTGEFIFDMNNITGNSGLVTHLKSPDFLDVSKYPTAMFKLSSAKVTGVGTADLLGTLTIKGISKPMTVSGAKIRTNTNGSITLFGATTFDRTQFNIRYGSASFFSDLGDSVIEDAVSVNYSADLIAENR